MEFLGLPYPHVCPNHHLRRHHMEEDYDLTVREDEKRWNEALSNHFGPNPVVKVESSRTNANYIIGNMEIMCDLIFPRLTIDERHDAMPVCKAWGKAIATSFFAPNFKQRYQQSIESEANYHYTVTLRRQRDLPPVVIDFKCDCDIWEERVTVGGSFPWWMHADDDENDYGEAFNPFGAGQGHVMDYTEIHRAI